MRARANRWPFALSGWLVGPACWAIATQAGEILPYADCRTHGSWTLAMPLAGAALAAGSAWLAWRALASCHGGLRRGDTAFTLVASLGVMLGALLAVAMLLQAIGPMVLTGCES
ncbi:hypothetical protein [Roseococcus sp. YIM B11640]|uniref:hypothetical protein n=1 Tax=Roseococcus sp. YIM B11640 TaxID=3133973 RepID=UPI003C79C849